MAHLYRDMSTRSLYSDRKCFGGKDEWQDAIEKSTTLYIGNLSFYTTEEQLYELFGRCGELRRIVMGLDRHKKTPCGFAFIEYVFRPDTEEAFRMVAGSKLDERIIRVDWDGGFVEGRQYGRGRSGGQVREEYRADFDPGRGGWGQAAADAAPVPQLQPEPRRQSFNGHRSGGDGPAAASPGYGGGGSRDRVHSAEPAAKRNKLEPAHNPRFREDKDDDDDDD